MRSAVPKVHFLCGYLFAERYCLGYSMVHYQLLILWYRFCIFVQNCPPILWLLLQLYLDSWVGSSASKCHHFWFIELIITSKLLLACLCDCRNKYSTELGMQSRLSHLYACFKEIAHTEVYFEGISSNRFWHCFDNAKFCFVSKIFVMYRNTIQTHMFSIYTSTVDIERYF